MENEKNDGLNPQYINQYLGSIKQHLKDQDQNIEKQSIQIDKICKDIVDIEKRLIRIEEFYNSSKQTQKITTEKTLAALLTIVSTLFTSAVIGLVVYFFNGNFDDKKFDNKENEIKMLYKR